MAIPFEYYSLANIARANDLNMQILKIKNTAVTVANAYRPIESSEAKCQTEGKSDHSTAIHIIFLIRFACLPTHNRTKDKLILSLVSFALIAVYMMR